MTQDEREDFFADDAVTFGAHADRDGSEQPKPYDDAMRSFVAQSKEVAAVTRERDELRVAHALTLARAEKAEAIVARVEAALDVRAQARAWMTHLGYEDHEIDIAEAWRQPPEPWLQDDPPQYVIELDTACGVARQYEETIRAALKGGDDA